MQMVKRKYFFDTIRTALFNGKLSTLQVQGLSVIVTRWEEQQYTDRRWLAYMLATVYHETARTMQPIEEFGKGKGKRYGKNVKRSGVLYDLTKYPHYYYGRGFVQLTWFENYETMGRLLNRPLLMHPELALDMDVATAIMFEGMTIGNSSFGDFTGKSLEHYFNDKTEDWVNARRIINGTDKANLVASYALKFYKAVS